MDVTFKNGYRTTLSQVAVRQWTTAKSSTSDCFMTRADDGLTAWSYAAERRLAGESA